MLKNENIKSLLIKLSTPAIIGLIVHALYNVIDTIFVGHFVGPLAIASLTICFPIQMIILAIGQTVGIGGSSVISRSLGKKDYDKANFTLGNVFTSITLISVVMMIFGLFYITPILKLFGATEALLPMAVDYLTIILIGSVFFALSIALNSVIRSEGNTKVAMGTLLVSAGVNIILDPIFIIVLDMGVKGAAIATVIAQTSMALYVVYYFFSGKSILKIGWRHFALKLSILKEMFAIGSSSLARHGSATVVAAILNNSLGFYGGDSAIAVFGIMNRVFMFIFMPMFGIIQGMQPIIGFNYGAEEFTRVKDTLVYSIKATTAISVFGFIVIMFFPEQLFSIFTSDPEIISNGAWFARVIAIAFPTVGFQVVTGGLYQSIGKAVPSMVISLARQVIFLTPLVLILPLFFKFNGLLAAMPIADTLAAILSFFMLKKEMGLINGLSKK